MYARQISLQNISILPAPQTEEPRGTDEDTAIDGMDTEDMDPDPSPVEAEKASLSSLDAPPLSRSSSLNVSVIQDSEQQEAESDVQPESGSDSKPKKSSSSLKTGRGYTIRTIVPAEKAEVVSLAKAMHREAFGYNLKKLFQKEMVAARRARETGVYIGWRCPEYHWDCFRLGDQAKCFCGHLLSEHQKYSGRSNRVPCAIMGCHCSAFQFIPSCTEEVGEMWLKKRFDFDPVAWRAKCRCKHNHEEHQPTGSHPCKIRGCRCVSFESAFLCAACNKRWEAHETFFETKDMRKDANLPYGADYLPFAGMPELRNLVLTGSEEDDGALQPPGAELPQTSTSRSPALPSHSSGPWRPLHDQPYRRS
ncbi:protein FAM221B [Rhinatrema bivittatum]|uniref:protein FAM221B n=1 Tax=Rhinatrema bivittatum TaxID=194408 RepID=UPI00112E4A98|nr:protein FAM221B [Rhinatrema bivittatum]